LPNDFEPKSRAEQNIMARRPTCENCLSIDVRDWSRQHKLWPTAGFNESWTWNGEPAGSISVANEPGAILLNFVCQEDDTNDWKKISQRISVVWTGCAFGGGRPWLKCPVSGCSRRVAIVYLAATPLFACRSCHDLTYASQLEGPFGRQIHKARKIQAKLGGGTDLSDSFPGRPKGMHNRTYLRYRAAYDGAAAPDGCHTINDITLL
jgi:hypothetical protein